MQHITAMKIGHETYDDNAVYYKGETWKRVNGFIIDPHTGEKHEEGSKELPWEANKIQIMAFKMKAFSGFKQKDDKEKHTTAGKPKFLYNADGEKVNTNNVDEGNLSKIKVESDTNRKYVSYLEGSKAGGRLYLSNPK